MIEKDLLRILIIDDEAPARRDIRRMLNKIGHVEIVGEAPDGLAAVEAIQKTHPDVVLLDIQMPGLDGFQVIEVWESKEQCDRCGAEVLGPIIVRLAGADEAGPAPEEFDVHTLVVPSAVIG